MEEKETLTEEIKLLLEHKKKENKALIVSLSKNSNIPENYFKFTWNDYQKDYDFSKKITDKEVSSSREKAKHLAVIYATKINSFFEKGISLFFVGKRGSGKTVLATLLLREAINQLKESVYYCSFIELMIEANTANLEHEREEFESKYLRPSFLLIDEMGEIETNHKMNNYLNLILIKRQQEKKPTFITSKLTLEEIKSRFGTSVYLAISNNNCFLPEIIIKTDPKDFIENIGKKDKFLVSELKKQIEEAYKIKQKEQKKNNIINPEILNYDDIIRILSSSKYL
jgi:DNA replication protein DnaC